MPQTTESEESHGLVFAFRKDQFFGIDEKCPNQCACEQDTGWNKKRKGSKILAAPELQK